MLKISRWPEATVYVRWPWLNAATSKHKTPSKIEHCSVYLAASNPKLFTSFGQNHVKMVVEYTVQ